MVTRLMLVGVAVEGNVLGDSITFSLRDAYPYEDVEVVIGLGGVADGPCFSSFGGLCLGLGAPVQKVGRIYADVEGAGEFTTMLPAREDLDGEELCVQLLSRRGAGGADSAVSTPVCILMGHDGDGDGLTSADELELGTDPTNPDQPTPTGPDPPDQTDQTTQTDETRPD